MNQQAVAVVKSPLHIGPIAVDNPAEYAERVVHPKITAARNLQGDPLAHMHDRKQITEAQYRAGRQWQREYELAGARLKSSGDLQEPVDGGGYRITAPPEKLADWSIPPAMRARLQASDKLSRYAAVLGLRGAILVRLVLADKMTIWAATARMFPGEVGPPRRRFTGQWLRDCLTVLAREMGLSS